MKRLTAGRANVIQREWMALDASAPEPEKQRVFKLMEELPKSYFAVSKFGLVQAIFEGQPMHASPMLFAECQKQYPTIQRDVFWFTSGEWASFGALLFSEGEIKGIARVWKVLHMGGAATERTKGAKHSHAVLLASVNGRTMCERVSVASLCQDDSIAKEGELPTCPHCIKLIERF
jgi:hypothetical protein